MSDSNTFAIDGVTDPVMLELLQGIASELVNNTQQEVNNSNEFAVTDNIFQNIGWGSATVENVTVSTSISKSKAIKKEEPINEDIVYENISVFDTFINKHTLALSEIGNSLELNMDDPVSIKRSSDIGIDIIVVGCGGTGSRLVALLAQQMSTRNNISLTIYDGDICEHKNLSRQNFFEFEVGENKADALAERYNMLYGIDIKSVNQKFYSTIRGSNRINCDTFVFDCTDNKDARRAIQDYSLNVVKKGYGLYIISCGNEKDYGQVHFSSLKDNKNLARNINNDLGLHRSLSKSARNSYYNIANVLDSLCHLKEGNNYLPEFLYYNKTFKDNVESTSCVNMDIAEEQSMAINSTIAQIAFNMFYQWLVSNDGLTNMIVHANLSNTFVGQKINTVDGLLDIYIRSIYGKGVFFEKDECKASLLNVLSDYTKVMTSQYAERLISTDANNDYKKSTVAEIYSKDKVYTDSNYLEYYNSYFDIELSKIVDYIDKNYSSTKENSYYLEILFLIDCYIQHLIAFRNYIGINLPDHYYNKQRLNSAIISHIIKLTQYFEDKFINFGGSYKFFEEEN